MRDAANQDHDDLLDYEEDDDQALSSSKAKTASNGGATGQKKAGTEVKQGSYVGIHSTGFKDFMLKPDLMRAVIDCGFEHPSQVQFECIPQAILGMDVICQAKSGMGKTVVFVLGTLHQLEAKKGEISIIVMCHTRELAFQIHKEFLRFSKYLTDVTAAVFFGGLPIQDQLTLLKEKCPNIVIGTPGRIKDLVDRKAMDLSHVKHFVLDECDKMLEESDMRRDIQHVFFKTPHNKQVLLFSATLSKEIRPVCKKFCQDPLEVYVDDETKLTLHGLQQYYIKLEEKDKNRKLNDLLDALEFNQVIIFVSKADRAAELNKLLVECNFPSIVTTSKLSQEERIARLEKFKNYEARILVSTDLFGRGIDIERVNIVVNYDFPGDSDSYLHRVNRAGRFGTKGLALSFVSNEKDAGVLEQVQKRFEVKIQPMPDTIDSSTYMNA